MPTFILPFLFAPIVLSQTADLGLIDAHCGQHYADFVNAGDTGLLTLHYGAPTATYTEGMPLLAGCVPAAGYYSEGQAIAKVAFTYAKDSLGNFFVQQAKSNDTGVASHTVTYEAQLPGLQFGLRPKNIRIIPMADNDTSDPGYHIAEHTYDDKGRIVYISWMYSSAKTRSTTHGTKKLASPPRRFSGKVRGTGSPTKGYEKFVYGDASNPHHATYYESLDQDGFTAVGYKFQSNKEGLLTAVESLHFEEATCPDGCAAPNSCCKDVGSNDTGTCFNVPCAELGGDTWHYTYDSNGRITVMNETTRVNGAPVSMLVNYVYDSAGRLITYSQPVSSNKSDTMFSATYDGNHIKFQLLFIIYPIFPEMWGFDPPALTDAEAKFEDFVTRFGHRYISAEERARRFQVFVDNLNFIERTNAQKLPYTLGVTDFADLTFTEWHSQFVRGLDPVKGLKSQVFRVPEGFVEPAAVDWVMKGAVTKVKNQGACGSCWTFASTGALEGAMFVAGRKVVDLSQQEILDCDKGGNKCQGGNLDQAFGWVQENGLCADSDDSYKCIGGPTSPECVNSTCSASCTKVLAIGDVIGKTDVNHTEGALEAAVAQQPVAVAIEGDNPVFQHYVSGVLTSAACGTSLDHGVLVVGYGTDQGQKYWKVKNSWGATYGEQGYIRLAKGKASEGGECGIRSLASYPTVKSGGEIII